MKEGGQLASSARPSQVHSSDYFDALRRRLKHPLNVFNDADYANRNGYEHNEVSEYDLKPAAFPRRARNVRLPVEEYWHDYKEDAADAASEQRQDEVDVREERR